MLESRAMLTPGKVALAALVSLAPALLAAQHEPPIPKELKERFGAWAEKRLAEAPEYSATELREERRRGKKGVMEGRRVVAHYTVRRVSPDRSEWIEERKLESPAEKGNAPEDPAALLPERVSWPLTLISRLADRSQSKMKYFFAPDTSEAGSDYALVGYRQIDGDGMIEIEDKKIYPRGEAWVDADDGHIVHMEEEFTYKDARYTISVDFGFDDVLKAWVAQQILVRNFEKGRIEVERTYSYTGFAPAAPAASADTASPSAKP